MAKKSKKVAVKRKAKATAKPIEQYEHLDKERVNNPHIGLVNESTDTEYGQNKKTYQYDPHLDPQLQWAGKAERTSFEVPVVSLHVHERIDPKTIIDSVKKEKSDDSEQLSLFEKDKKPLREAIEFYKHKDGWSNRLIAGDSLLIMNSLLEKEGMKGKVQMVYFDPPFGIKYGSNFQPFVISTSMKSTDNDEDLTQEPEMLKAFRDTWELGIHSYLAFIRDRAYLSKEMLSDSGSFFLQISEENIHRVRLILDEVFGAENFVAMITVKKGSTMFTKKLLNSASFYLLWYCVNKDKIRYRQLYMDKEPQWFADNCGSHLWAEDVKSQAARKVTPAERKDVLKFLKENQNLRMFGTWSLNAQGTEKQKGYEFNGQTFFPPQGTQWKTSYPEGLDKLKDENRLQIEGNSLRVKLYLEDGAVISLNNLWDGIGAASDKIYVVQTSEELPKRCILMATDPGDLVLDITCGSGTTASVSENWGRRWITCDTSRVAIALAKQRLLTNIYRYYTLKRIDEGIPGGFDYKTLPYITIESIVNREPASQITLFDQAKIDTSKVRVTGPFTVESIPAPFVKNLDEETAGQAEADQSVTRSGETLRQDQWRDELQRTGARGKGGAILQFSRIETQEGTRYIQAVGETKEAKPQKVLIVFGPEHAPLDARVVELAIEEARQLKPKILLFCAFQFDEEAAKDIDETSEKLIGFKLLKAHMNMDLQTDDLKKQKTGNQSFWLIGQPDVRLHEIDKGDDKGKVKIEVAGFDYYNPKTGAIDSGGSKNIAMWMLDTDYDGRSLFPKQIFFPMAGPKDGWARLAKNLKAEIDEEKIEAFRGTVSLAFTPGKLIAVKIIDDRGIESLKIIKR